MKIYILVISNRQSIRWTITLQSYLYRSYRIASYPVAEITFRRMKTDIDLASSVTKLNLFVLFFITVLWTSVLYLLHLFQKSFLDPWQVLGHLKTSPFLNWFLMLTPVSHMQLTSTSLCDTKWSISEYFFFQVTHYRS